MNDKGFGQRVRQLRETASLTREQFCDDELELSVRQLTRIEAGTSKPTLSKIQYIANRLGMSLYELMPDYVKLPNRYLKLKFEVLRTPTYENEELMDKRNQLMEEIYDNYYDDLPEEEQVAIDAFQSFVDIYETKSVHFGKEILDDYFEQVHRKDKFTVNDLLIIRLYLEHLQDEDVHSQSFQHFLDITRHFPTQMEVIDSNELFILRDVMLAAIGVLGSKQSFDYIPPIFATLDQLMVQTHDFQKKPILNLLKWKYELYVNDDKQAAQQLYQEAVMFAKLIGDNHLVAKLEKAWVEEYNGIAKK
ncbi:helix-turn-helix domain-containing protein [Streptococcus iners]|uniref:Helix-turn-helix domain-containing protein n=1 Tax=Streptococcus iners subsp. hyiners TaxID=3028083 RepID=A0AA96VG56_9STRE|nr:helix-turn-helix domain-containing protein [Streptococcus sp. 29892]MCK4029477.1 helix-turn-helix transcriptional regulator [Streptococcus suis]WNY49135.1 helix-turn-helix domain-containing protein [Streptococcus sp. 29892]